MIVKWFALNETRSSTAPPASVVKLGERGARTTLRKWNGVGAGVGTSLGVCVGGGLGRGDGICVGTCVGGGVGSWLGNGEGSGVGRCDGVGVGS